MTLADIKIKPLVWKSDVLAESFDGFYQLVKDGRRNAIRHEVVGLRESTEYEWLSLSYPMLKKDAVKFCEEHHNRRAKEYLAQIVEVEP